ncbi:MAG TPA: hypothetical protein VKX16_07175, partial [Chloroflexota bacterium]|nr:hypothetical protein [Chloroflexota bacterium]
ARTVALRPWRSDISTVTVLVCSERLNRLRNRYWACSRLTCSFLLIFFEIAALLWSVDSRDGIASPEWERQKRWYGRG